MGRLRHRLRYRLLCAILIPVLLQTGLWIYLSLAVATPMARDQAARNLTDAASSAGARVEQTMRAMDAMSLQTVVDAQVKDSLRHEYEGSTSFSVDQRVVNDAIARILAWTDVPVQIGVMGSRSRRYGEPLAMNWDLSTDPVFRTAARDQGPTSVILWSAPYANRNLNPLFGGYWMGAARAVPDDETGANLGMVVAEIPVQSLGLQVPGGQSDPHVTLALLAPTGNLITGGTDGLPGRMILADLAQSPASASTGARSLVWQDRTYVLAAPNVGYAGWRVVALTPLSDANLIVTNLERTVEFAAGAAAFVAILLAWFLAARIDRPLQRLLLGIRQVREGHWSTRVPVLPPVEIAELSVSFNSMAAEIESTLLSLHEIQQRELDARLEVLSGQINGHFLFNALEVIDCAAFKEGPEAVSRVVRALGRLLRYTLDTHQGEATLQDELRHVESYLLVQSERFDQRLSYRIEGDPALLDCLVPRFSLQPLVENAVKHGVFSAGRPCTVTVRAGMRDGRLCIEVEDDGVGLSQERAAALRESLEQDSSAVLGIGLLNVQRRLRLSFGPEAGLEIEAPPRGGAAVRMRLPVRRQVASEDAYVSSLRG